MISTQTQITKAALDLDVCCLQFSDHEIRPPETRSQPQSRGRESLHARELSNPLLTGLYTWKNEMIYIVNDPLVTLSVVLSWPSPWHGRLRKAAICNFSPSAFWGFGVCWKPNGGLKLCSHPKTHFLFLLPNLYSASEGKKRRRRDEPCPSN